MKKFFLILSLLVLTACSESLDIQLDPEVNVVRSNDRENKIRLTSGDKAYEVLNEWLSKHNSGWYPTNGQYPGGVYLKSGGYGIQVTDTHVILYSTTSDEPKALYIQRFTKGELSDILNVGMTQ